MSSPTTHRVVTGADGQPVLVKRATEPAAAARLTGEATVLRTLAHPATVRVVDVVPSELHLAWVGPHSLATVTGLPVPAAGELVAQVAATVADLHRAGIVHRRLTADHVLLAPGGRAVLTGLADAVGTDQVPDGPADDVAALGALLTRLVAPQDGGPVVPESRRARSDGGGTRAALLTLADRAQADDRAARPTAAELAAAIHATVGPPPRRRTRPPTPGPTIGSGRVPPGPIASSRGRVLVGVLGAAVVATVGAAVWIGPTSEEEADVEAAPTTTAPASRSSSTSTTASTTTTTAVTAPPTTTAAAADCPAVAGPAADVDGDGCVEAVAIDGERVTVGHTTWRVGRPGDVAVVADWDCDGQATVASLRVDTGEVFVFDRWERALTVEATAHVDGATGLRAVDPDGDGCADLVADRLGAGPVTVEVAA